MTPQVLREAAIELSFEGRFNLGIDQWPYVPFDVPPGFTASTSGRHTIVSRCWAWPAMCWISGSFGLPTTKIRFALIECGTRRAYGCGRWRR
jgi:hypothetical protein